MTPTRPDKPCRAMGCGSLIPAGRQPPYCEEHRKEKRRREDQDRPSAAKRGYDRRWRRFREWFLRQKPLCEECKEQGRTTAAKEVHHIKPIKGPNDRNRLDPDNCKALCKSCHSRITAKDNW